MKFAHLGDCHLGGWRQPELQDLNFKSFQRAIEICISQEVEFVLIAGDLFDSAYPPIEILKETFAEFRKLKDAGIRCYMIAGSHDYSVSGKTFLDVIKKAGFCEICEYDEKPEAIYLKPIRHKEFEIYGYPGKKSGLEVEDLKKIILPQENTKSRILMLHTSLSEAIGNLPIEAISANYLPKADYYALGHLHINFEYNHKNSKVIYSGPIFPNSFQELEDLCCGRFYIIKVEGYWEYSKIELPLKEVKSFKLEIKDTITGTDKIITELSKYDLTDKIILLKLFGDVSTGTNADLNFSRIESFLKEKGAYSFLKNTSKLETKEEEIETKITEKEMDKIEEVLIAKYAEENNDKFNALITPLIRTLELQKQEDEKSAIFESRLFSEINKVLGFNL
jgi:DNA repair exonuclease SbcCD nuclease subunit